MRMILSCVAVCALLCAGFGTLTAAGDILFVFSSLGNGTWSDLSSFEQGQKVGRVVGGTGSGLCCGSIVGLVLGGAIHGLAKARAPQSNLD